MLSLAPLPVQAEFRSWTYALMALIFAGTTPIGVAIGIGIQSSYNENSTQNLVVSGVFDSISTGDSPPRLCSPIRPYFDMGRTRDIDACMLHRQVSHGMHGIKVHAAETQILQAQCSDLKWTELVERRRV